MLFFPQMAENVKAFINCVCMYRLVIITLCHLPKGLPKLRFIHLKNCQFWIPSKTREFLKLEVSLDGGTIQTSPSPLWILSSDCSPGSTAAVGLKQPTGSRALICVWPWRKPERDAIIWCMALHHTNQWQIGPGDPKYTTRTQIQPSASSLNYRFCLHFDVWNSAANKERPKGRIIKIKMTAKWYAHMHQVMSNKFL